jgi:hypothetical protein
MGAAFRYFGCLQTSAPGRLQTSGFDPKRTLNSRKRPGLALHRLLRRSNEYDAVEVITV